MKLTIILLTVGFMNVSAKGLSQNITISAKNVSLETVFDKLEQQTGYLFFYTRSVLSNSKPVTIEASNEPLNEFLKRLLADRPLSYTIRDRNVIVAPIEAIPAAGLSPRLELSSPPPIDVRGRITTTEGEPVAGASVMVKGTNKGTTTDADGNFVLNNVDDHGVLVISGSNIEEVEYSINGRNDLGVMVKKAVNPLDEVVFNAGYYKVKDRERTGSISKVTSKEIEKQPVNNVMQALQGRMPGVQIVQQSGVPGASLQVQIRGRNSIRTEGNFPLYIVDGLPFSSQPSSSSIPLLTQVQVDPLNSLNPADIMSIEVLKDADATSIYGSRGANGVVLITTKSGQKGKTNLEININRGISKACNKMSLLNTKQYLAMRREAFANDGQTPLASSYDVNGVWDTTRYTDWQKELFGKNAEIFNSQVSFSGGSATTYFRLAGSFLKETTVFPGDFGYKKATAHLSLDHTSTDKRFHANVSINYGHDDNNLMGGFPTTSALSLAPNSPRIWSEDGKLNWENLTFYNPFVVFNIKTNRITRNLISNASVAFRILPDLHIKTNIGYSDIRINEIIKYPLAAFDPWSTPLRSSRFHTQTGNSWIIEPQLTYLKKVQRGTLNVLFGSTWQSNLSDLQILEARGFLSDNLMDNINASSTIIKILANQSDYKYDAFFGRLGYNWDEKYYVNVTSRRDGSSKFGPGNQFANFAAIGLAWIFSKENFISKNIPVLSFGKLRASYGTTGSDQISDYGYLSLYDPTNTTYQGSVTLVPSVIGNPDFAWEVNRKLDVALEIGLFKDRIMLSANGFLNRSSNQLLGFQLPLFTGFSSVQSNLAATVQNTGFELDIATLNIRRAKFKWNSNINFTFPKNKLLSYPDIEASPHKDQLVIGQPLSIRKSYYLTGVNPTTGLYDFLDVDGNGSFSNADRQVIMNMGRRFYGGLNNSLSYRSFECSFFIEFVSQKGLNYFTYFLTPGIEYQNQPTDILNYHRWRKADDQVILQRFSQDYGAPYNSFERLKSSNVNVTDQSFVRLKNVSFSYGLPANLLAKSGIEGRLYVQAQNIVTITKFKGLNVEAPGFANLPSLQTFNIGIKVQF